jgi:hypothetical protein
MEIGWLVGWLVGWLIDQSVSQLVTMISQHWQTGTELRFEM